MKITEHENEIEIQGISDFDLAKTFGCGQCFRWSAEEEVSFAGENEAYIGVAYGKAAGIRRSGKSFFISCSYDEFESVWRGYFDLDRDYAAIRRQLCIDDFMKNATGYGKGIRLLQQDKWEALCSFIISQNNNIPRIIGIIDRLCREFGEVIYFEDKQFYTFPSAATIASVDEKFLLSSLRCGYRADYIVKAAQAVADGNIDLDALAGSSSHAARAALKRLHGVGDKVADCVMLFGLHMLDSFPVDVWMKRAVASHYGPDFDPGIFSPYAGIAQQYIYHYTRNL